MVKIVGILNITPDSFSDGGKFNKQQEALEKAVKLLQEGADIIDIGAESTRPQAKLIDYKTEWQRLENILPQLINLCHQSEKKVSLDSRHSETIEKALNLGLDMINDVSGGNNLAIIKLAKKFSVPIVINHNLGLPASPEKIIGKKLDICQILINWAEEKIEFLINNGIKRKNIIIDLGIGFGKDQEQSLKILANIKKFQILKTPLYIGHSRKSFLNKFTPKNLSDKDNLTLEFSKKIANYVDYLRVHNVLLHSNTILVL